MTEYFARLQQVFQLVSRRRIIFGTAVLTVAAIGGITTLIGLFQEFYPPPAPTLYSFGEAMKLTGMTLSPENGVRGGEPLDILLEWRAERKMNARYVVQVQLVDSRGHIWADHVDEPANGKAYTDRWGVGQRVLDLHTLELPPTMPAGNYSITVQVYDPDLSWNLVARNGAGRLTISEPPIVSVQVQKNKSMVLDSQLQITQSERRDMGDLSLLSLIPNSAVRVSRGEPLHIGLLWRARVKPSADYLVAIQFRDNIGNVVYENATRPAASTYPTTQWDAGEVLLDWHDFPVPISFRADPYQMFAVVRDSDAKQSLGEVKIMDFSVVR